MPLSPAKFSTLFFELSQVLPQNLGSYLLKDDTSIEVKNMLYPATTVKSIVRSLLKNKWVFYSEGSFNCVYLGLDGRILKVPKNDSYFDQPSRAVSAWNEINGQLGRAHEEFFDGASFAWSMPYVEFKNYKNIYQDPSMYEGQIALYEEHRICVYDAHNQNIVEDPENKPRLIDMGSALSFEKMGDKHYLDQCVILINKFAYADSFFKLIMHFGLGNVRLDLGDHVKSFADNAANPLFCNLVYLCYFHPAEAIARKNEYISTRNNIDLIDYIKILSLALIFLVIVIVAVIIDFFILLSTFELKRGSNLTSNAFEMAQNKVYKDRQHKITQLNSFFGNLNNDKKELKSIINFAADFVKDKSLVGGLSGRLFSETSVPDFKKKLLQKRINL